MEKIKTKYFIDFLLDIIFNYFKMFQIKIINFKNVCIELQ